MGCPPSGWELQGAVHLFVGVLGPGRLGTGAPAQESEAVQTERSERLRPGVGGWFSLLQTWLSPLRALELGGRDVVTRVCA